MTAQIPITFDFKRGLKSLGHAGVQELSRLSGVPFTTLWKIRSGETANPGIETVKAFSMHLQAVSEKAPAAAATTSAA